VKRYRKSLEEIKGEQPVVRDAEGDPVENPTVSGILPPLPGEADAAPAEEAQAQPEPEPVAEPEPAPEPEPEPEPEPAGASAIFPPTFDTAPAASSSITRPELVVGAAFVGGVALAILIRRLGSR
jgi:hypothetical protein